MKPLVKDVIHIGVSSSLQPMKRVLGLPLQSFLHYTCLGDHPYPKFSFFSLPPFG
jgi:hypothetical protein